jgi:hypothetical protein
MQKLTECIGGLVKTGLKLAGVGAVGGAGVAIANRGAAPAARPGAKSVSTAMKPMTGGNKVSDGKGGWINLPDGAKPWQHPSTKHMYDSRGRALPMSQIQQPVVQRPQPVVQPSAPVDRDPAMQARVDRMRERTAQMRANAAKVPVTSDVTNGNTRTITRSGTIKPSPEASADYNDMQNSSIVQPYRR